MMASTFQENCISVINGAPSKAVFFLFDLLDNFLCIVFRFLDQVMEEKLESCQCNNPQETAEFSGYEFLQDHQHLSETLYRRRNVFREAGFLRFARKLPEITKKIGIALVKILAIATKLPRKFRSKFENATKML
ncbi:alpha/beta-Hydrolases superfamily protein [Raphanus sativus]|nr:alpha/beta-Hydrolases superfamily protein [Raphanus sativus]